MKLTQMSKLFVLFLIVVTLNTLNIPNVLSCTLDPSTSKIIDESLLLIGQIKGNVSLLNITLSDSRNHTENYLEHISQSTQKVGALITLIAYNIGYNNTNSVTIKQYTETYFPAITLTLLFLIFIMSLISTVLHCKKFRKPITLWNFRDYIWEHHEKRTHLVFNPVISNFSNFSDNEKTDSDFGSSENYKYQHRWTPQTSPRPLNSGLEIESESKPQNWGRSLPKTIISRQYDDEPKYIGFSPDSRNLE